MPREQCLGFPHVRGHALCQHRPRRLHRTDDQQTAGLMGINDAHVFGLAMALAMAVVSIAAVFLSIRTSFDPSVGPARLLYGFEAVIIGGLGSLWGTLAGDVIPGVAQAIGTQIDPGWQILAGHLVFLLILVVRPRGLFPRSVD
ncbi:branched-chain amino acid ABC transporter permease [Pseudomonas congelans]|uniref:branched-chain amino acid ABC transporter permease n=1 Tax=Pseudomonas congelans TaxID=200452 RepID=UPI0023AB0CB2|nr:branched-chain amino acid ABC transporter permease [Pseudomonas congelans]